MKEGGQRRKERRGGGSNHIGNGEKTRASVDESLMEGGANKGGERLFSGVLGQASVTNRPRVPTASPVSRRCHWPPQWARGQAVTLSR